MFPTARIANFVIFAGMLAAFEWFVDAVLEVRRGLAVVDPVSHGEAEWPWLVLFYSIFFWSSFDLLTLSRLTPEICVAALSYMDAALLLKIRFTVRGAPTFLMFGFTLGLAYLAKTAMFPIGLVFLLMVFLLVRDKPGRARQVAVAAAGFLAVSAPFILWLSCAKGRITIGDAGAFNYTVAMDVIPFPMHWQKDAVSPFETPDAATARAAGAF